MRVRAIAAGGAVVVSLLFASSATATFPGANGLLAVQPVSLPGIVLVAPNGKGQHRLCRSATLCGSDPADPRWSPDGRSLLIGGPQIALVYPDSSCLNCQFAQYLPVVDSTPFSHAASFTRSSAVLSVVQNGALVRYGIDGLPQAGPSVSDISDAVWSADGRLAVVRGGWVWAGLPDRLRRVARGSSPSWAPSSDRLVAVQRNWVVILRPGRHSVRRLARGSAPTFSPDGHWVAFVRPDERLMIVSAVRKHARARPVGTTLAVSVDWQPKPRGRRPGCVAPPGSKVAASSPTAVITSNVEGGPPPKATSEVYMGCLRADGRERTLRQLFSADYVASTISTAALAAPYAGLVEDDDNYKYQDHGSRVLVFDLRTGEPQNQLGGEGVGDCRSSASGYACDEVDQLALGSDGVSAAHTELVAPVGSESTPLVDVACAPASTLCLAADRSGPGSLHTSNDPSSGAPSWSSGRLPPPALYSPGELACPSPSLCVAAANGIFTSTSPQGGASTWTTGFSGNADGISCPTTGLCVASLIDGRVATSTNPAGGPTAWSASQIDSNPLNAVVCSTAPRCFISDARETVFTSSDPSGGAGAWTVSPTTPQFSSGSCPTPSLCVTVSFRGIATTTNPDGGAWTQQSVPNGLNSVSCPSPSLCVAVGYNGALYASTDPASGTWSSTTIDNGRRLNWVSCASVSLCEAVDQTGHAVTSTNPSGGPSAWTPALIDGDPCNDTTVCSVEQIQTSDKSGVRRVADSSAVSGTGPYLTGLTLTGDTVTWSHNGAARSTTLTP